MIHVIRSILASDSLAGMQMKEVLCKEVPNQSIPFNIGIFTVNPGVTTPIDSHKVKEIWVVTEGNGILTQGRDGEQTVELKTDSVIYFESLTPHSVYNPSITVLKIISIWW